MQLGNRLREDAMMVAIEQSDAVRTYQCSPILLACVENALFHLSPRLGLFAKACRDDDKGTGFFVTCQQFHRVRAQLGRNDQDGQFGGRQFTGIMKHLDALHLVFFRIDNAKRAFIATLQQVAYDGSTRLVDIVGTPDNCNGFGG